MGQKHETREKWLVAALDMMRPEFKARTEHTIPAKTRVTCSWPLVASRKKATQVAGQCFPPSASVAGYTEVFISPTSDNALDVLGTLCHELVHAAVGCKEKHNAKFVKVAREMLLEGKPKSCGNGDEFDKLIGKVILAKIGPYPHKEVRVSFQHKKQGTRLIKCECAGCGYIVRTTSKWIATAGAPLCPTEGCDQEQMEVS